MKFALVLLFCVAAVLADDIEGESSTPKVELTIPSEKSTTGLAKSLPSLKGEITPLLNAFATPSPQASTLSGLKQSPATTQAALLSQGSLLQRLLLQQYGLGQTPLLPQAVVNPSVVASRLGQPTLGPQLQAPLLQPGLAPISLSGLSLSQGQIAANLLQSPYGLGPIGLAQVPIGVQLVNIPLSLNGGLGLGLGRGLVGGYNPGLISSLGGWSGLQGYGGIPASYGLSRLGLGGIGLIKKK